MFFYYLLIVKFVNGKILIYYNELLLVMIIGCDEAGRGPVLGSMFITAVRGSFDMIPNEVDDSKRFSNKKILRMYDKIKNTDLEYKTMEIKNSKIDNNNITEISKTSYAKCINEVSRPKDKIYIDCFSNNKSDILSFMKKELNSGEINVEFGADESRKIVGASSIISKSKREIHVNNLSDKYKNDIGSGYPSDPTTREFLKVYIKENGEPPECARESWNTITKMMNKYGN